MAFDACWPLFSGTGGFAHSPVPGSANPGARHPQFTCYRISRNSCNISSSSPVLLEASAHVACFHGH
eukprot:3446004-Amphidinium_carterae.1